MATAQPPRQGSTAYEETHVHDVYEAIAPHFSATRHKPWPLVSSFLASQPPGSVGLDVGCGNGKNMGVNRDVLMLGCDRSRALAALARDLWCREPHSRASQDSKVAPGAQPGVPAIAGADVAVADGLDLPFRQESADFVICIAVIHHLSTRERRVSAVRQLLRCIHRAGAGAGVQQRGGRVLIYVWALEQSTSRRGWDEGGEQDLLVPWVMKTPQQKKAKPKQQRKQKQEQEQAQEQEQEQEQEQKHDQNRGQDRNQTKSQGNSDETVEFAAAAMTGREDAPGKESGDNADRRVGSDGQPHTDKTFHRFYHLYRKGELEEDVVAAGGRVLSSGYERDNWWVVAG